MHLDPSTPVGVLDTLGHLSPLLGSIAGTVTTLYAGLRFDRRRK